LIDKSLRPLLFILGWISVILGFIGALLPIMPTTPFLILAAYLFSKSSPKFHAWLLNLPKFGPIIQEWESQKTIKKDVKITAIALLSVSMMGTLIFVNVSWKIKSILVFIWISVSVFIATRKSQ
tara:strand:- start:144346 stop:144717 length:372 start_codon:yes stop_codon:yes gene_type:complete